MTEVLMPPDTAPADAFARDEIHLMAPLYPLPRIDMVRGRGAWIEAADGTAYLDFVSGIAVNALGHASPVVARAVAKQVRQLAHVSNLFTTAPARALAATLSEATGHERVFFCNSGTEAIEAALKFSRSHARARGREGRDILAFRGGFHGRTALALSATWNPPYREPFEPLVPGIRFADFNDVRGLDAVLDAGVCAVVVEPVQGEGGGVAASRGFLEALRARTQALGATLVFDEIQIGMGRSGRLLASQHYGVHPDVTVLSKALGGGLPLAAVLMSAAFAAHLAPGMHGCTFGGGPVTTAAGLAVLDKVRRPAFLARVRSRARALEAGLRDLIARHPKALAEVRGLGLLRALELKLDAPFDPPALVAAAREQGLLLIRGGERAVRLLPPLTVTPDEITEAIRRLDRALASLVSKKEASS